ncbi:hypothetical protein [Marinobacter sp.]|uniref:hypothetical protein n=1 Tax=Marinobacter sp. TaxID=50741 RepID=UPI002355490C|nr:hypothetical protein [Marinobacter sp.]|tara:strand:+ start:20730 stop:20903 length:174 start_codon:yes stop_codon:yes gene_type:complete
MQYWKHKKSGKVERIESTVVFEHPEKLEELKKDYEQVSGEDNWTPYEESVEESSEEE